jgi:PAS domain S-box-containing protein
MLSFRGSSQLIIFLSGILVAVVATMPALIYFIASYNRITGRIEAEARGDGGSINRFVAGNPLTWDLNGDRILDLFTHYPEGGEGVMKRVLSAEGTLVLERGAGLPGPLVGRRHDLTVSAEVVGRIEVYRSLHPILVRSGMLLLFSWAAGATAFSLLRGLILRVFMRAEKALRESERKYRHLFTTESVAIVILDAETQKFIDINDAALRLYGYGRRAFLSLRLTDISAEPGKTEASVRHTVEEGLTNIPLRYHRRHDGSVFPVEIAIGMFTLKNRKIIYGVIKDISARIEGEKRLLHYQEQLQGLVAALASTEERERRELAAVLHDDIGQLLAMCKLNLEGPAGSGEDATSVRNVVAARQLLEKAIARTRALTWELSSQTLYEIGLEPALEELCGALQERHAVRCGLRSQGASVAVPQANLGTLYRATRELLVNAIKHAEGTRADVAITAAKDRLKITVSDNGGGFSEAGVEKFPNPSGRFGLFNIRERLRALGGDLKVASSPGKGARVTLSVPLGEGGRKSEEEGEKHANQSPAGRRP